MIWQIIHIIDIVLWLVVAISVFYIFFFALVATIGKDKDKVIVTEQKKHSFLILFPAYKNDEIIKDSVVDFLKQTYPKDLYTIVVIADGMQNNTIDYLNTLPIKTLVPTFDKSSKANSLQFAMHNMPKSYDNVVILDIDNVVSTDFLEKLNEVCNDGYKAIQCHRCAKNSDNEVAVLDGISEEINNTLFRKAHNYVGLSSALIGSGMCFDFKWFKDNVDKLSTAGEDRELEELLIKQNVFIRYEENIPVYDEKVCDADNFQRQRMRWMTAQTQSFLRMLKYLPTAIKTFNINFINKTIQQSLIPRSLLLVITFIFALFMTVVIRAWGLKWWILFFIICISLFLAIPSAMRTRVAFSSIKVLPTLALRMFKNIRHIDRKNTEFLDTSHQ